jgi:UDPglucose--hexose-1-phosphate uridylyltransferase|tara:strand:+ start:249 stop:1265 length:1017 start_codon:yes stop_codon:yes gene_type:complete
MGNLRKDFISERFVIINQNKSQKPKSKKNPYKPGNESMTNPSVLSLVQKDGMLQRLQDDESDHVKNWTVRVFPSSEPGVTIDADNSYTEHPLHSEPAYGYHYIVVATSDEKETLSTMNQEQWGMVLSVVQDRLRWLYTQKGVAYVAIYGNHGKEARVDVMHPHLHMMSFSTIPPKIEEEANFSHRLLNENGVYPMSQLINIELGGPRQILQTESFVAISPWAPSYPYEFWICPKKHSTSFSKISQKEIYDLALIIRATLGGLSNCTKNSAYNIAFHLSPEKKNSKQIHWHIEVYPQTTPWSGLERGFGIFLHDISPEKTAEELGAACRKELSALVGIV